jgi:hypothetical protein
MIAIDNETREKFTNASAISEPSLPCAAMFNIFQTLKIAAVRIPNQFTNVS